MAVMSSQSSTQSNVLDQLILAYPDLNFRSAKEFYWSPKNQTVYYQSDALQTDSGVWALMHEVSHGLKNHQTYTSDFELLLFEVQAWEKAKEESKHFGVDIDAEHIENCLDTYRDWLYARSTCINCHVNSFQISPQVYMCINCGGNWRVSTSRFCRPYRKKHQPEG